MLPALQGVLPAVLPAVLLKIDEQIVEEQFLTIPVLSLNAGLMSRQVHKLRMAVAKS